RRDASRRNRSALRGDAPGDLAAPARAGGGAPRRGAPRGHPSLLPGEARDARRAEGVPGRLLGQPAEPAQGRRRSRRGVGLIEAESPPAAGQARAPRCERGAPGVATRPRATHAALLASLLLSSTR